MVWYELGMGCELPSPVLWTRLNGSLACEDKCSNDYARCHNFKHFFSNVSEDKSIYFSVVDEIKDVSFVNGIFTRNILIVFWIFFQQKNYSAAWDKIKAKSYQIPHDSHALKHAKQQKIILSSVSSTLNSVHFIPCYYAGIFFSCEFGLWPSKDNVNLLAPLGEVQGGLWEVQIPLQSAQVSWGWSWHCSLCESWKAGPRCKLNLLCNFILHMSAFLLIRNTEATQSSVLTNKQLKCIELFVHS